MSAKTTKATKEAEVVLTEADLRKEIATKQQDLVEAKRALSAGELANTKAITGIKKEIARLMTKLTRVKGKV